MSIAARLRIFTLILLSAFFVVLLAGCGGHSLAVYEPIGESPADMRIAKTTCNQRATQEISALRRQAMERANQNYQARVAAASQRCSACRIAQGNSPYAYYNCLQDCQKPTRPWMAAPGSLLDPFADEQQSAFCTCMTGQGWGCLGMLKFRDVNAPIPKGDWAKIDGTPLHAVAIYDNADSVHWLISHGADVGVKDSHGATPLHYTASKNAVKSAEMLLNSGADINARTLEGVSPLHMVAIEDSHEMAKLLVKYGADINIPSNDDWLPLHTAARNNSRKVAGLLISEGANIEAQGGDEGRTPLHTAVLYGHVKMADLLIARGANLDAKTYTNETPLDIAKREGKRDVVALLERAVRAAVRKAESADESGPADGGAESVFESAWRSVVVVIAGDSQGGGVVVNEPNQVATNCHVVDESPHDIRVYKGENRRAVRDAPHSAKIVSGDRERDVCILFVPGLWAIPAKIRPVAELEIGEAVYAVGTPKGLDFSISNGIVSQLRKEAGENAPLIQTNAAISPGSSGGGLFDSQGRLVGLTTWKIREGENLNFAVPIDWVLEFE